MNTNKQTLIESINRQRKLMGLNEIMDVNTNIDAKGALSGNKLDLGIVPLEEMDPDDEDDLPASYRMYNSDEWVQAQKDAFGDDDDDRSEDEDNFYRGEDPMSLDDRMDMDYPDPNERDWQANRYGRRDEMMDELGAPPVYGTPPGVSQKPKPPVIRMDKPKAPLGAPPVYGTPPGVSQKPKPPVIRMDKPKAPLGAPPVIRREDMMNEAELDEGLGSFFGGLSNVAKSAGNAVGGAVGNAAKSAANYVGNKAKEVGSNMATQYKEGSYKTKVAGVEKEINKLYTGLNNYVGVNDKNLTQLNDVKTKLLSYNPTNPTDKTQKDQLLNKIGILITATAKVNSLLGRSSSSIGSKLSEDVDEGLGSFFGGLSNVAKSAGNAVGGAVGNAAKSAANYVGNKAKEVGSNIASKYNVGALNTTVNNVEKTMKKSFFDMKKFLDTNSKVYTDINNLTKQVQMLQSQNKGNQQLQNDLVKTLNKLNNTNKSLTYLKNFLDKQATSASGTTPAANTNVAQSGQTAPAAAAAPAAAKKPKKITNP